MKFRVTLIWVSLLLAPLAHAQESFVVPSANAAVEGNANNAIPFTIAGGNVRNQQVYRDEDVPAGPFTIYGVAFRPDMLATEPFEYTIPEIAVYLTTTTGSEPLDDAFALNAGSDYTLVASGPITLSSAVSGSAPFAFDIEIWFDEPFEYVSGNLLLDVQIQQYAPGVLPPFDAVNDVGDPVSRVFSAALSGGSVLSPTGTVDEQGLVTKFQLVPEPAGAAVTALAALAVLLRARRR